MEARRHSPEVLPTGGLTALLAATVLCPLLQMLAAATVRYAFPGRGVPPLGRV